MQLEDLKQVQAIDRLSFSLPWPESAYHYELTANPAAMLWVAESGERPEERRLAGMIVVWMIMDEAHIATVAVHPELRGQGIGTRLLVFALAAAIRKGARQAMLEVRSSNLSAQALYRRLGFEVVSRRPRYYRDNNEDALLMNLTGIGERYLKWLESGGQGQWTVTSDHPSIARDP
jgi:ribosomal-protein-alanine N-acetyltransferase